MTTPDELYKAAREKTLKEQRQRFGELQKIADSDVIVNTSRVSMVGKSDGSIQTVPTGDVIQRVN